MSAEFDEKSEPELVARHHQLLVEKPWLKDQHYFKNCRITRLALMKIWTHAHSGASNTQSGDPIEVIGILLGYLADEAVSICRAFMIQAFKFTMSFSGYCHRCHRKSGSRNGAFNRSLRSGFWSHRKNFAPEFNHGNHLHQSRHIPQPPEAGRLFVWGRRGSK
jgi:uncharacterized UBP type Zn finger protein